MSRNGNMRVRTGMLYYFKKYPLKCFNLALLPIVNIHEFVVINLDIFFNYIIFIFDKKYSIFLFSVYISYSSCQISSLHVNTKYPIGFTFKSYRVLSIDVET